MKKDFRKEVDKILSGKLDDAVKAYQAARESDFQRLTELSKSLEGLENKKAASEDEKRGLNPMKSKEKTRFDTLTLQGPRIERNIKKIKAEINSIMKKLTEIEIDPKTLTLLLHFKGVKDV